MKSPALAHLPIKVATIVPVITNSVIKATHGEPPLQKVRLARAITHTQLLLDELKSAQLVLDKSERENDVA